MNKHPAATAILAMERSALDQWGKGEPSGYLAISAPEVSYFDPIHPRRVDGHQALSDYYGPIRGLIRIERDEIIEPRVQIHGQVGILTFQFISEGSEGAKKWNCTEVYVHQPE